MKQQRRISRRVVRKDGMENEEKSEEEINKVRGMSGEKFGRDI
jgi:hypothetical protein